MGYSFRLETRVLLYAPSHTQDSTYHGLCYTSRRALAGTRNSSMGSPHEGSIRRPLSPRSYISLLQQQWCTDMLANIKFNSYRFALYTRNKYPLIHRTECSFAFVSEWFCCFENVSQITPFFFFKLAFVKFVFVVLFFLLFFFFF